MSPAPRVLIVEDNQDLAELLQDALVYLGSEVEIASTAEQGLVRYNAVGPHLALIDLRLGGGSGLDLARQIGAGDTIRAKGLVVAVTGMRGPQLEQEALAAGFDRVLWKPFDLAEVQSLLAEALSRATAP